MEAKDTVMSDEQFDELSGWDRNSVLLAQAEISFKARADEISSDIAKIEISAKDNADFRNQIVDYFTKRQPKISPYALPSQAYDQYFTSEEQGRINKGGDNG